MADTQWITVTFSGTITAKRMPEVRQRLLQALSEGERVSVDCTAVTEADSSFIHALHAARAGADHTGKTLQIAMPASAPPWLPSLCMVDSE